LRPNFSDFRKEFQAKLEKLFLIPANTFDNVKGSFPIGFFVWNTEKKEHFKRISAHVYNEKGDRLQSKKIVNYDGSKYISEWLEEHSKNIETEPIGNLASVGNDFQNQRMVFIENVEAKRKIGGRHTLIYSENLSVVAVYFAVRHCIKSTWINDRDQFLYPKKSWEKDTDFHNDCLVFTLFNTNIKSKFGANHWIPFAETEINAKETFASSFMSDFIAGKIKKTNGNGDLFNKPKVENGTKCRFSPEAQAVFDAGKALYKYYHSRKNADANAGLYDIREHFQGRNSMGKMNNSSTDEKYSELIGVLREKLKVLAEKIAEKVYEHGFLDLGIWRRQADLQSIFKSSNSQIFKFPNLQIFKNKYPQELTKPTRHLCICFSVVYKFLRGREDRVNSCEECEELITPIFPSASVVK